MSQIMPYKMQCGTAEMLLRKNYKIETDTIDIKSEIDSTLTFEENWHHIFDKYVRPKLEAHNH